MATTFTASEQGAPLTLLRLPEVIRRTGKCRSDIYREIAAGTFPKQVKLSERSSAWVEQEVQNWVAQRVAARERAA
jgi:prophage regulatory protein